MTEFGTVKHVGISVFLGLRQAHTPKGRDPSVPKIYRDSPTYSETAWPTATKSGAVTRGE